MIVYQWVSGHNETGSNPMKPRVCVPRGRQLFQRIKVSRGELRYFFGNKCVSTHSVPGPPRPAVASSHIGLVVCPSALGLFWAPRLALQSVAWLSGTSQRRSITTIFGVRPVFPRYCCPAWPSLTGSVAPIRGRSHPSLEAPARSLGQIGTRANSAYPPVGGDGAGVSPAVAKTKRAKVAKIFHEQMAFRVTASTAASNRARWLQSMRNLSTTLRQ